MESDFTGPVNIGSQEMVTINQLADIICQVANKQVLYKHIKGPLGVRGRNSDNDLIQQKLGWKPSQPLIKGIDITYRWIVKMVEQKKNENNAKNELLQVLNYW